MTKKLTTLMFVERANKIHNNYYDYSQVSYKDAKTKVVIICPEHNIYFQTPDAHLRGRGCRKCATKKLIITQQKTTLQFIEDANKIHNFLYDYSLTNYQGAHKKVIIICFKHGQFKCEPSSHLSGKGCKQCASDKLRKTVEFFIEEANKIHNFLYDYSKVIYVGIKTKVRINCDLHGEFLQTPHKHLAGQGCPRCKMSKGEKQVNKFLTKHNYNFITQYAPYNLINKQQLKFDFYLPDYDIIIEFHGKQHYEPIKWSRNMSHTQSEKLFQSQQIRDNIKIKWCQENNKKLIIIKYSDFNIIDTILFNTLISI